jgi:hypothetical protein
VVFKKKVCVIIYGIGRGIELTERPINKIIKDISKDHEVDVNYIINEQKYIDNVRTGEKGLLPKIPEKIFCNARRFYLKSEIKPYDYIFDELKKHQDSHKDSYKSYHNLLLQLRMLNYAKDNISFDDYDYVVCFRDDIFFKNPDLNWNKILKVASRYFVTTTYGWNKGVADRFFVSNINTAKAALGRIDDVIKFVKKNDYITGEQLIYFTLSKLGIDIAAYPIKIFRVRINLELHKERHLIPLWRPEEVYRIVKSSIRYITG